MKRYVELEVRQFQIIIIRFAAGSQHIDEVYYFIFGILALNLMRFPVNYYCNFTWCVYDIDHMSALQIKNTSESDPCSYEVTLAVRNKAQKNILRLQWDSNP